MAAPPDPSPFAHAVSVHERLRRALRRAGFASEDFPCMVADVNPLGQPRVAVGPISTETAERLAVALGGELEPAP